MSKTKKNNPTLLNGKPVGRKGKKDEKAKAKEVKATSNSKRGKESRFDKIVRAKDAILKALSKGGKKTYTAEDLTGDKYVGTTTRKRTRELFAEYKVEVSFTKSPIKPNKFGEITFFRTK